MEEKKSLPEKIKELFKGRMWMLFIILGFALIFLVMGIIVLVSPRGSGKASATVVPGQLTVAIVTGEDRFSSHDEKGKLIGLEPDLAERLAEAEGLVLNVIEVEQTDEAMSLLDAGAADAAFGCISDDQNLGGKATSISYGNSGLFLVTALHDYTDSLTLMSGYSVGVLPGVKNTAQGINGYEFVSVKDYEDAAALGEDIRDRVINMGIVSFRDAVRLVKSYPQALQTQEIAGGAREYYVAVFPASGQARATLLGGIINAPHTEESEEEAESETAAKPE